MKMDNINSHAEQHQEKYVLTDRRSCEIEIKSVDSWDDFMRTRAMLRFENLKLNNEL